MTEEIRRGECILPSSSVAENGRFRGAAEEVLSLEGSGSIPRTLVIWLNAMYLRHICNQEPVSRCYYGNMIVTRKRARPEYLSVRCQNLSRLQIEIIEGIDGILLTRVGQPRTACVKNITYTRWTALREDSQHEESK